MGRVSPKCRLGSVGLYVLPGKQKRMNNKKSDQFESLERTIIIEALNSFNIYFFHYNFLHPLRALCCQDLQG